MYLLNDWVTFLGYGKEAGLVVGLRLSGLNYVRVIILFIKGDLVPVAQEVTAAQTRDPGADDGYRFQQRSLDVKCWGGQGPAGPLAPNLCLSLLKKIMTDQPLLPAFISPQLRAAHKKNPPVHPPFLTRDRPVRFLQDRQDVLFILVHPFKPGLTGLLVMRPRHPPVVLDLKAVLKV